MTTINFDGISSGSVTDQYAAQGVNFSNAQILVYSNAQSSAPNGISATSNAHFDQTNPITITFDNPQSSVSILGVDVGDAGAILKAYDANDQLIGSDTYRGTGSGGDVDHTLAVTTPGIKYVKVSQIDAGGGNDGIVFDNLTFSAPVAPTYSIAVSAGSAAPASTASGAEGTPGVGSQAGTGTTFTYTVSRTGDTTASSTIGLSFAGSTATSPDEAGGDYTIASGTGASGGVFTDTGPNTGTVQFQAGQSTATFTATSTPDSTYEPDESLIVTLTDAPSGSTIDAANTATATILNDDSQPSSGGGSTPPTTDGGGGSPPPSSDGGSPPPTMGGGGGSGPLVSATPSAGPDILTGTSGSDTIAGLAGDDTIAGGGGDDLLLGNQGNDIITDGDGNSTIAGGMNDDRITVGDGSNLLYGGEGSDTIRAGNGGNTILGGTGNAAIDSLDGADLIVSGSGNDLILGNGGDDTVAAGAGRDTVAGGFGNDVILGNQGDDIVLGNQGDDTLFGGYGNDTLVGGQGNDVLIGGQGDDVLYGNEGLNTFVFNPGDTDFKSGQSTGDTVADFVSGSSRIDFASGPAGTAQNFGATSTTSTDFAAIQAAAQTLIDGGHTYAFVADGVDGFLFTTGGNGTAITDAVKLAGAGTVEALKSTDIAHGALA